MILLKPLGHPDAQDITHGVRLGAAAFCEVVWVFLKEGREKDPGDD